MTAARGRPLLASVFTLLAGLATGACLSIGSGVDAFGPVRGPDPWRAESLVPVRVAAAEGRTSIELETDDGDRVELLRHPNGVSLEGRWPRAWQRLELPPGARYWLHRGRAYAGDVLVETAPEGGLRLTALLELEEYVEGVVAAELVLWSASDALLESQAIAARSYALSALERRSKAGGRAFVFDSVLDQAFRGRFLPDPASRSRGIDRRLHEAVQRTRGQILAVDGALLDARFHASCGGRTARGADVFVEAPPRWHSSVVCSPCAEARGRIAAAQAVDRGLDDADARLAWDWTASSNQLADLAREFAVGDRLLRLDLEQRDAGGRWLEVSLVGDAGRARLPFSEVRRALGWSTLKSAMILSTWPHVGAPIAGGLRFDGIGNGHGAGLCQHGAAVLAERGGTARSVLTHYYPEAEVRSMAEVVR
jgi:stage II sporulation protein D